MHPIAISASTTWCCKHMITQHNSHTVALCMWYLFADWLSLYRLQLNRVPRYLLVLSVTLVSPARKLIHLSPWLVSSHSLVTYTTTLRFQQNSLAWGLPLLSWPLVTPSHLVLIGISIGFMMISNHPTQPYKHLYLVDRASRHVNQSLSLKFVPFSHVRLLAPRVIP